MTCRECRNLIDRYIEGLLDESELVALRKHIETCPECRKEFDNVSCVEKVLADAFVPRTSAAQAREAILPRLASAGVRAGEGVKPGTVRLFRRRTAVAAALLIVGVFIGLALPEVIPPSRRVREGADQVPVKIAEIRGVVLVKHAGADVWEELQPSSSLRLGDQFQSTGKSAMTLALDDGSTVRLGPNSTLLLKHYDGGVEFNLAYGTAKAVVEGGRAPFVVSTPHGRIEALGTEFVVSVK